MNSHQFVISFRFTILVQVKANEGSFRVLTFIVRYAVTPIQNLDIGQACNQHHSTLMGRVFLQDGTMLDPQVTQAGKTSELVQVSPISQFGDVQVQADHFIQTASGFRYTGQGVFTQAQEFQVGAVLAQMIMDSLKVLDVVTGEKKLPEIGMTERALWIIQTVVAQVDLFQIGQVGGEVIETAPVQFVTVQHQFS